MGNQWFGVAAVVVGLMDALCSLFLDGTVRATCGAVGAIPKNAKPRWSRKRSRHRMDMVLLLSTT